MDVTSFVTSLPGLLTACADLYRLTVDARRIGADGVLLVTKASIEQAKFYAWLEENGFVDTPIPALRLRPVQQKLLHDILEGIRGECSGKSKDCTVAMSNSSLQRPWSLWTRS